MDLESKYNKNTVIIDPRTLDSLVNSLNKLDFDNNSIVSAISNEHFSDDDNSIYTDTCEYDGDIFSDITADWNTDCESEFNSTQGHQDFSENLSEELSSDDEFIDVIKSEIFDPLVSEKFIEKYKDQKPVKLIPLKEFSELEDVRTTSADRDIAFSALHNLTYYIMNDDSETIEIIYNVFQEELYEKLFELATPTKLLNENKEANVIDYLCEMNCIRIISFLHLIGYVGTKFSLNYASATGNNILINKLIELGYKCNGEALEWAIVNKQNKTIELIYKAFYENNDLPSCVFNKLCEIGNLKLLKMFYSRNNNNKPTDNSIELACKHKHYSIIKWALKNNFHINSTACSYVCSNGNFNLVKTFHKNGINFDTNCIDYAARNGKLDIVKYIFTVIKIKPTTNAIDWASQYNHLKIVKFLVQCKCSCTTNAMDSAAELGYFPIFKYLHSVNGKCSKNAIIKASVNGHKKIVKFMYETMNVEYSEAAKQASIVNKHSSIEKIHNYHSNQ